MFNNTIKYYYTAGVLKWCSTRSNEQTYRLNQKSSLLAQCFKILMTPLKNIQQTRAKEGIFYENLRPNHQLDVIGYKVLLQNFLKTFICRIFSCYLPNQMKNFTVSRLFFYLYLASKGDQNTFYLFQSSN